MPETEVTASAKGSGVDVGEPEGDPEGEAEADAEGEKLGEGKIEAAAKILPVETAFEEKKAYVTL